MTTLPADSAAPPPQACESADESNEAGAGAAFPIVGIGASAGGLEAFTQLLRALPVDTGMAFVLVQHLAPTHASALSEILSRATPMPVTEVRDETAVEPNHVYVIPPGQSMNIARGVLQLLPREASGVHRPIDQFFRSLSEDRRHQAIGVVLSGTASDGTLGLEAIKAEGGLAFAQDATAQQQGMPQSAIASGCVDAVLPPDAIARELARIARHPYASREAGAREPGDEPNLTQIVRLLHHATGVDFTRYKLNTLYRRITRRMLLQNMDGLADYVKLLRQAPAELDALHQDILIGVTSFFRNPEAFEALKSSVLVRLLSRRDRQDPVRIWTLGCSTGQEAYSLAMAFAEVAEAAGSQVPLQLFATDLNAASVEKARAGAYPKDIAQDVSPERLRRFFVEVDGCYRISKALRETCVFSRHDVLADPPFSRMDLISCRNLLIYLESVPQQKIFPALHYALKPGGFLWLGGSEAIGASQNLFETEDAKHKIYARRPGPNGTPFTPPPRLASPARFTPSAARPGERTMDLHQDADRLLLSKFAPPSVLVSANLEILQYRGDTGAYLAPAPGKASLHLLKMLREGLVVAVRAAVLRAGKEQIPVREEGLRVKSNGDSREVAVEVVPVKGNGPTPGGFLIVFEEARAPRPGEALRGQKREPGAAIAEPAQQQAAAENARLEQELSATREYLQSMIEQQETTNEEVQAANEELQSANEELQSINEELETSKEEIQSSNEELATVNDELNNRNAELNRLNDDLVNVLGSVQMAIVIAGADCRLRRFTPAAEKLLGLIPTDVGRPLGDLRLNLDLDDLGTLLAEVLATVRVHEREVQDRRGRWYSLRLHPYRTLENKIDGVVMMLVDVDALKRAHQTTASIVATVREPLLVLDSDLRVRTASRSFYETFHVTPERTDNRLLFELGRREWDIPKLRRTLEHVLSSNDELRDFDVELDLEHMGKRNLLLNARKLAGTSDREPSILLAIADVSERKELEHELRRNATDLAEADRRKNEFLAMLAHELRNPLAPIRNALEILRLAGNQGGTLRSASMMMERQVAQMVRLVDDLLDVSRISLGKIDLRKERIELGPIVHQVVEAVSAQRASMNQELTVSLPPQPVYLDADPTRLAQVLSNLLNNAYKFTAPGGHVALTVEVTSRDALAPAEVAIRVRDSGVGIAEDQLPHIFEMFVQVDSSLRRSQGGLGIGLSLVKNLVEMHGGTVEARSAGIGHGSELTVRLPPSAAPTELSPVSARVELANVTERRILVVDDNRDAADSLAELLQITGAETCLAYDGRQALEAARTFLPEVVLLDIGMPELDGYEVARRIRAEPWGKTMVLVALTGWGHSEDRRKSKAAGFDGHLVKPVAHDAITKMLAKIAKERNAKAGEASRATHGTQT